MSLDIMRVICCVVTLLIVCEAVNGGLRNELQCKDENNSTVDWYVMYKLPKTSQSSNPLIRKGVAYLFISNRTVGTGWRMTTRTVNSEYSIPGLTLAPLYDPTVENDTVWNLYSDSAPDAPSTSKYGHTKGVVMANREQGFWLIHSVPNFPPVPKGGVLNRPSSRENVTIEGRYAYPDSATYYGQSFLCISLRSDQFDIVGKQLMYNEISVYAKNMPDSLAKQYPVLKNATEQKRIKKTPYNNREVIASTGFARFISFAKGSKWLKDLYADFVSPQLQADLYVQTWQHGRGKLPSLCKLRKVYNVKSLKLEAANIDFSSTRDHSKWAVTMTNRTMSGSWVCIGDINRADTQFSRGGGAVCLYHQELWLDYRNAIRDVEYCPS